MTEQNDVRDSGQQAGFIVGCIVSSVIWWIFT